MTPAMTARLHAVEVAMARLESQVEDQAQDVVAHATRANLPPPVYIQNSASAVVHLARPNDDGRTICGWSYRGSTHRARNREGSGHYTTIESIENLPGGMLCDKCLKTERCVALAADIACAELSCDE